MVGWKARWCQFHKPDDLEPGTQALVLINALLAVVIINILLILGLLVGISLRNFLIRFQLFGTIVIPYMLVHTFPDFFGAL
jgi:hypothetical protein